MKEPVRINLDTSKYRMPTQDEVNNAKRFIRNRERTASALETIIDNILTQAAGEIAEVCLKYNIPAKDFSMTVNKQMFTEVSTVMDRIEEEIMSLIQEYSLKATNDKDRKKLLAAYIASLGRGNNNLQDTLEGYLYRYLYDLEAIIAAMKLSMENNAKLSSAAVVAKIKSSQHSIYTTPEVKSAMSAKNLAAMQATYIRTRGNHSFDGVPLSSVGVSNSNANNVVNMAKNTMAMAWMKNLAASFQDNDEVVGFWVARGSSYDCKICNSQVGFHKKDDLDGLPLYHSHCCCVAIPIYGAGSEEIDLSGIIFNQ